jgi:putative addiction module killer protein
MIDQMEEGQFGDSHDLSHGLWECRLHFGPGYRIYYLNRTGQIIILLCGGNKSTQRTDIKKAEKLRKELNEK